jgi:transcriptional regulator with XRE-family HTH domain
MEEAAVRQGYSGVGFRIREIREGTGRSLRWLAKEIDMKHPVLSKWERGMACIDADKLPAIAEKLGVDPCRFFEDAPREQGPKSASLNEEFERGLGHASGDDHTPSLGAALGAEALRYELGRMNPKRLALLMGMAKLMDETGVE